MNCDCSLAFLSGMAFGFLSGAAVIAVGLGRRHR